MSFTKAHEVIGFGWSFVEVLPFTACETMSNGSGGRLPIRRPLLEACPVHRECTEQRQRQRRDDSDDRPHRIATNNWYRPQCLWDEDVTSFLHSTTLPTLRTPGRRWDHRDRAADPAFDSVPGAAPDELGTGSNVRVEAPTAMATRHKVDAVPCHSRGRKLPNDRASTTFSSLGEGLSVDAAGHPVMMATGRKSRPGAPPKRGRGTTMINACKPRVTAALRAPAAALAACRRFREFRNSPDLVTLMMRRSSGRYTARGDVIVRDWFHRHPGGLFSRASTSGSWCDTSRNPLASTCTIVVARVTGVSTLEWSH